MGMGVEATRFLQGRAAGPRRLHGALCAALLVVVGLLAVSAASAALPVAGRDAPWDPGSTDCAARPGPALEVHRYDARTFILREGLCATAEAPFLYLLIGSQRALLIDSGHVADPHKVDLATAVGELLPSNGAQRLPLVVVHTHRHLDHRAGDPQLAVLPNTQVTGFDLEAVKKLYKLPDWPQGSAQLDLGGRIIDVIPTPGHSQTEVTFYDRDTAVVFSGDFLLPGRILVDDIGAYRASAARLIEALRGRPVTAFMGGHIEMNAAGELFQWQSQVHPNERTLPLAPATLPALAAALAHFNGFYTESGGFTMVNSLHDLEAIAAGLGLLVAALVWGVVRWVRRRPGRRAGAAAAPAAGDPAVGRPAG